MFGIREKEKREMKREIREKGRLSLVWFREESGERETKSSGAKSSEAHYFSFSPKWGERRKEKDVNIYNTSFSSLSFFLFLSNQTIQKFALFLPLSFFSLSSLQQNEVQLCKPEENHNFFISLINAWCFNPFSQISRGKDALGCWGGGEGEALAGWDY